MGKLIHEALSEHILGAALAVLNELKLAIRDTWVIRGQRICRTCVTGVTCVVTKIQNKEENP